MRFGAWHGAGDHAEPIGTRSRLRADEAEDHAARELGVMPAVDVKVFFTRPCMFSMENHYGNMQGGAQMTLTSAAR